jgi:hypothetical protein
MAVGRRLCHMKLYSNYKMEAQLLPVMLSRAELYCAVTEQIRMWTLNAMKTSTCSIGRRCYTHSQSEEDVTPTCSIGRWCYTHSQSEGDVTPTCSTGRRSYTYNIIRNPPSCFVSLRLHFNCLHTKPNTVTLPLTAPVTVHCVLYDVVNLQFDGDGLWSTQEIWYWEN